jgi:oxygen-independent coproporphyrinogen III oxidase
MEQLSEDEKFNEYILTRLRTKWGISMQQIVSSFGQKRGDFLVRELLKYKKSGFLNEQDNVFTFTRKGMFISDEILSNLMII